MLGAFVDAQDRAEILLTRIITHMEQVRRRARALKAHPQIYFDEW